MDIKNTIKLLVVTLILASLPLSKASAQNVKIVDTVSNTIVNGTEITVTGDATDTDIYKYFKVTYSGFGTVTLNLRRIELNVQSGTKNTACWGLCPTALDAGVNPVWDYGASSIPPVDIISSDTVDNLQVHHQPEGLNGCSLYRYTLYDVNNPSDTVYVDVRYLHNTSGICNLSIEDDVLSQINKIKVYPNPATNNVKVEIDNNVNISSLVIVDMLGKTVKVVNVSNQNGISNVDVSNLNEGFYFVKVMDGSNILKSQKLMIRK